MANKATKKKRHHAAAGKRNPAVKTIVKYRNKARRAKSRRNPHHASHRRNPFAVAGYGAKQILQLAGGAFVGAISTRLLTSKVLGPKNNEGFLGYATNAGIAIGLGWGGARLVNPVFGGGILAGGGGTIVQRFWDEKVAKLVPVAALAISGGASDGKGMGDISYDYAGALEGYYNTAYMPTRDYTSPIGLPAAGGGPVSVPRGLHMAAAV